MTTGIYNVTDTWNDAGTVFTFFKGVITDTAYASGSRMVDISATVSGDYFRISNEGVMELSGGWKTPLLLDGTDPTKIAAWDLTGITTATTRTLFMPDYNVDLGSFYGVMSVQAGSTAEATTDATPRKLAGFTTDGIELGMTVDSTTGNDIEVSKDGIYKVSAQVSFSGTNSKTFVVEIYNNTTASGFSTTRKLGTGGDVGSCSLVGLLTLAQGDKVSLYHHSTDGGTSLVMVDAQLTVERIK